MVQKIERLHNVVAVIQMQIKSDAKKENSEKSPNSEKNWKHILQTNAEPSS